MQNSYTPLILGIVGAVVLLPNLLCSAACGTFQMGVTEGEMGLSTILFGIIPVLVGFIGAFLTRSNPPLGAAAMFVCTVAAFIILFPTFTNLIAWAALILFLIAGIITSIQIKETES